VKHKIHTDVDIIIVTYTRLFVTWKCKENWESDFYVPNNFYIFTKIMDGNSPEIKYQILYEFEFRREIEILCT